MKRTPQTRKMPPIIEVPWGRHMLSLKNSVEAGAKCYNMGECFIILGHSPAGWHMSISAHKRYPTWDEIAEVWYKLTPANTAGGMILPPPDAFVNISQTCLHIWEIAYTENAITRIPTPEP